MNRELHRRHITDLAVRLGHDPTKVSRVVIDTDTIEVTYTHRVVGTSFDVSRPFPDSEWQIEPHVDSLVVNLRGGGTAKFRRVDDPDV